MAEVLDAHRVACHECDLLNDVPALAPDEVARCARCNALLYRNPADCLDKTLALSVASLFLYLVANTFPFLGFGTPSNMRETSLISGVIDLYRQGMPILAVVVFATSLLFPAFKILGQIYVILPLKRGRVAPRMEEVFRLLLHTRAWSMMEIFLLGILVAFVKLSGMAQIVPGIALWAFGCLVVTLAWSGSALEPRVVWDRAEALR
jgi:paraquat-inducible protein A